MTGALLLPVVHRNDEGLPDGAVDLGDCPHCDHVVYDHPAFRPFSSTRPVVTAPHGVVAHAGCDDDHANQTRKDLTDGMDVDPLFPPGWEPDERRMYDLDDVARDRRGEAVAW